MKVINDLLYIEFSEMLEAGIPENTIKSATFNNRWHFIKDPKDQRKLLIGYEELKDNYKKLIQERFGNPYEYIAKIPVKKLVTPDFKAEQFYKQYRYDEKFLPIEHVKKYTAAASWLNMLNKLYADKKIIKKELNLSVVEFFKNVGEIIKTDNIELPFTYTRLLEKMKDFQNKMIESPEAAYGSLISWRFGNKQSAKLGKTVDGFDPEQEARQVAFIRKAASMHQNFDAMQITSAVNKIFVKQGWPTISHGTVYNLCKENAHLTLAGSRGKREYNNKVAMQIMRTPPKFPLFYLTLDGWTVELLYQEKNTFHNRLVVVVVLDAVNKYPLGYAIGDRENAELIRQANRNAASHIKELFGDHYQPRQLQSDNYALKANTPFYQAMAHLHTPAAVGNAKAKIIEPYFKYLNKAYCQRLPNWSGFNVNASKENQPNTEFLDMIKNSFPDKQGVIDQINMIIRQERKIKIQEYLAKWSLMPDSDKLLLNKMDMLMVFGQSTGYTNSITGQGLMPTIEGQKITYDSFDPSFRALQHLKWQVVYDKDDLSQVLAIAEGAPYKFVLDQKRALPMDLHSMLPEDHNYMHQVRNFNKERMNDVVQTYITDNALVEEVMSKTTLNLDDYEEASLKLMFTYNGQQKERLQDAKGLKQLVARQDKEDIKQEQQKAISWQETQQQYLQSKTDFNQYLD